MKFVVIESSCSVTEEPTNRPKTNETHKLFHAFISCFIVMCDQKVRPSSLMKSVVC